MLGLLTTVKMTAMNAKPRLLIISFSPLRSDARILKQIKLFTSDYEVTTCGIGDAPDGVARHVEVTAGRLWWKTWDLLLQARLFSPAYWLLPHIRQAKEGLKGHVFDVILANDLDTLPLALLLKPVKGVHSDLHEYFPRLHEENAGWSRRVGPWYTWMCRRFLPQAASVTTVGHAIAQEYASQFGVNVNVVRNVSPGWDLNPSPVEQPIRVVHSGTSHRQRNLTAIIDGVLAVPGFTLDLYLTATDPTHLAELKERAKGEDRLTVHDAVPYAQLIPTLNRFDIGAYLLPPLNFNFANALPNKVFDFIQARLALIFGPTPEVANVVNESGIGIITDGFTSEDLSTALRSLTPQHIKDFKERSHILAQQVRADIEVQGWKLAVDAVMNRD